jgi:HD-GYP domain-containing protein (c-di-GMP phosphodiesterase class II)
MISASNNGNVSQESHQRLDINHLRDLRQLIAFIGKQTHRSLYQHIHPHDHATSRLAHMFATFCIEQRRAHDLSAEDLEVAALYHDVGKYSISESIVLKPGKLTAEEYSAMANHPVISNRILSSTGITSSRTILDSVLHHHEHWGGTGYPDALAGTRIPLPARILAVADIYISLREEREYKEAWPIPKTLAEMTLMAGPVLDPNLFEDFLVFHDEYRPRYRKLKNANTLLRAA